MTLDCQHKNQYCYSQSRDDGYGLKPVESDVVGIITHGLVV